MSGTVGPRNSPPSPLFIFTVDTTKAGSASDTFILKFANAAVNLTVYWGDGNSDVITTYNQAELTHVYSSSGSYQLTLDGSFGGIGYANFGDKLKLMTIDNWGTNVWSSIKNAFYGCTNLTGSYSDVPDTSTVVNFDGTFRSCTNFNSPLLIDTSSAVQISSMFRGCTAFDQDVSSWDISLVTNASNFLYLSAFSTTNYDLLLVAWEGQTEQTGVTAHFGSAKYSAGAPATARGVLVSTSTWTITDGGAV